MLPPGLESWDPTSYFITAVPIFVSVLGINVSHEIGHRCAAKHTCLEREECMCTGYHTIGRRRVLLHEIGHRCGVKRTCLRAARLSGPNYLSKPWERPVRRPTRRHEHYQQYIQSRLLLYEVGHAVPRAK